MRRLLIIGPFFAFLVAFVGFVASPGFQEWVCGFQWPLLDEVQKRGICYQKASWTATTEEIAELTDDFLQGASGSNPMSVVDDYFYEPTQRTWDSINDHWQQRIVEGDQRIVVWAQRIGEVNIQRRNEAKIRYELYESERREVPPRAVVRVRDVDVRVEFDDDGNLRIVAWSNESRPNDAADDDGIGLPRVLTVADTRGYVLPTEQASHGSLLPTGDTVRLICRLVAPDRDWTRTTDGWVPTEALPNLDEEAPGLAECQAQHAQRARALEPSE